MRGKILFATGLAVGYVLGTRAGRERYEQIRSLAQRAWQNPRVQKQVHTAEDFVGDQAKKAVSAAADKVSETASNATSRARSRSASTTSRSRSTGSSAPAK